MTSITVSCHDSPPDVGDRDLDKTSKRPTVDDDYREAHFTAVSVCALLVVDLGRYLAGRVFGKENLQPFQIRSERTVSEATLNLLWQIALMCHQRGAFST